MMKLGQFEFNRTYCMDNIAGLQGLPDACIDLTVTSPPYDDMDDDFNPLPKRGLRTYNGYTWDFKGLVHELYRVTKPGGVCVWVVNDPTIDGSESLASCYQKIYFRQAGWNVHDTMIYCTSKPPENGKRYEPEFEYMFIMSRGIPVQFFPIMTNVSNHPLTIQRKKYKSTAAFQREKDGEFIAKKRHHNVNKKVKGNIWSYRSGFQSAYSKISQHPAIFPEALARDHIISWSSPGDIVLDPFHGSGTTGKMAIETGRQFIGFEISQEYTDLCNRRTAGAKVPLFDWTNL